MVKIDFWVEGIADQKFLADIIANWFDLELKFDRKSNTFICEDTARQIDLKIRGSGGVASFISEEG
jgi:hypothetical protein